MKRWIIIIVFILVVAALFLTQDRQKPVKELTIFAAASLTDVMRELTEGFTAEHPDVEFVLNFGSSGALQIQIEQGAPVDIFASAGVKQMQALTTKALIDPATVHNFAANRLVAITPLGSALIVRDQADLLRSEIRQIATGETGSVPAGQYAREALQQLQVWDLLQEKLVYANDVRQVLQYVEQGEVELGFVYATDAAQSTGVQVVWTVPPDSHREIIYPVGIIRESTSGALASEFIHWLLSPAGQTIIAKYGFERG